MDTKSPSEHADAKAAQARLEAAKEDLQDRLEEIGRRFTSAKDNIEEKLDVREHIARHPWPSVGIALAAGALAGFVGGRKTEPSIVEKKTIQRKLGEALLAAVGTLIIRLVREAAFGELKGVAQRWMDEHRPLDTDVQYSPSYVDR